MNNLRVDARMSLARYESSVSAFGMEAGFPMKDVRVVQEYIDRLEAALLNSADRIEKLEAALIEIINDGWLGGYDVEKRARKVLEGKNV